MKVCYFLSTASVAGGANRSLLDLIRQLKTEDEEYSCFVIANAHGSMEKELQKIGVKCYVQTYANAIQSKTAWKTLGKRVFNIFAKHKIKRIICAEHPDIVHNNSLPTIIGMEASLESNIPYICHIRENVWDGLGMQFYSPAKVKKLMNDATAIIAISEYIKHSYENTHQNNNTVVLNDGIVIDDYYDQDKGIFNNESTKMLIVGVINPQKGQMLAVKAAEQLIQKGYNVELTILGLAGRWKESTQYADDLKEYIRSKGLTYINICEPINDIEELKSLRKKQDINIVCSRAEGLGRTTIESMLSGSLTIAANGGATPEIIKDGENGLLFENGNAEDLADKIAYAIDNKDLMKRIAITAREQAKSLFSVERYAKKMLEIYKDILAGERS